ncbi:MAG TPA: siphovirus Gp157 family protein [Phyllobacterium sp.]|nr:siphovirus Gp157 family protein [Phyllobacterium sp.]
MSDVDYALRRETEVAKNLLQALERAGDADDEEIVETAIEGETGLLEAIQAVIDDIDLTEAMVIGLEDKIESFDERKVRLKARIERQRAAIEQAMILTEREKLMLPSATLYLRRNKPGIVVDDPADIPSDFYYMPPTEPKLDKKKLKAALEDGKQIEGAHLDNGSVSLTVKRK